MTTVNRSWLKRQIDAGKIEAKCTHHLTDDYRFDVANGYGKTDWLKARICRPTFKKVTLYNGNTLDVCDDHDFIEGQMNFNECDFTSKSGRAYRQNDGTIHLYVHSNASYELREAQP